jgi:hypothetical protein
MIAAVGENGCEIAAVPDEDEFCCTTVTKGASTRIKTDIKSARLWERVMICSDGAWRLMFEKTKIKKDVCKFLIEGDFDSLGEYLKNEERFDDCSFITMELI